MRFFDIEDKRTSPRATSRAEIAKRVLRARRSSMARGVQCLICFFALLTAMLATSVRADLIVTEEDVPGEGNLTTFKMTVSPAAEPVPALKHRLVARELDLKQGNAVPYYYRSLLNIQSSFRYLRKTYGDAYDTWYSPIELPLDEIPMEKAEKASRGWRNIIRQNLREATMRRQCEWDWQAEEIRGPEVIGILLEEIQESRELCRGLMLVARVDLAKQLAKAKPDYEQVLETLRINYRLGHDIAEAPFLVSDLVGIAICGMGNRQVIELIAQPDSPNLYWAIAELPDPMVSVQESMQSEMSIGLRVFPFILDSETAEHSPEEWSRLMAEALVESQDLMSRPNLPGVSGVQARLAVTGLSLVAYPAAKQRLIDQGMTAEEVQAMPVGKVVSIDALREYRRIADSIEKWSYVPYREARKRDIDKELNTSSPAGLSRGYGYTLARTLLPAVQSARSAEQRLVWQTRGIQTVEAIRMHAAETGKLPESLDEVELVPLPRNPITEQPYKYKLEGNMAMLDLPFEDGFPSTAWRFEISLDK